MSDLIILTAPDKFPVISSEDIIIDAIFGSGLTRPAEGLPAEIIREINKLDCTKISIDIPSGLFGEDNSSNNSENIIRADYTLSFQFPKLSFMFAENFRYIGEWFVLPIGLHDNAIKDLPSPYTLVGKGDVLPMLKKRKRFDHKGNFGHGLFISGSSGKMGASILGARAALRSGIGLLTCHIPSCGIPIMQGSVPEAMVEQDPSADCISEMGNAGLYSAVAVGPGLGTDPETQTGLAPVSRRM